MNLLPPTWDHGKFCEYHNFSGHDTENCYSLKNQMQDLIEKGVLEREARPANRAPNVVNNPLLVNQVNMLRLDNGDNKEEKVFVTITNRTLPLPVSATPTIDTVLECNMITWKSLLGKKKEVNLVADNAEVSHLARSGKVYQPIQEEVSNAKVSPRPQVVSENDVPEDPVLTQMKKTNANISI